MKRADGINSGLNSAILLQSRFIERQFGSEYWNLVSLLYDKSTHVIDGGNEKS